MLRKYSMGQKISPPPHQGADYRGAADQRAALLAGAHCERSEAASAAGGTKSHGNGQDRLTVSDRPLSNVHAAGHMLLQNVTRSRPIYDVIALFSPPIVGRWQCVPALTVNKGGVCSGPYCHQGWGVLRPLLSPGVGCVPALTVTRGEVRGVFRPLLSPRGEVCSGPYCHQGGRGVFRPLLSLGVGVCSGP